MPGFAARTSAIELVFLPPAPDLNPIEFIWKTVKRVISGTSPARFL